jgi:CelD/BcsL family acetyltransferase involved in cellulose biosynthesis
MKAALTALASGPTPFHTREWLDAWALRFSTAATTAIEVESASHFTLSARFENGWKRYRGLLPVREVRQPGGRLTTYKGPVASGDMALAANTLVAWLVDDAPGWDIVVLDALQSQSGWAGALERALQARALAYRVGAVVKTPYIALPATYEALHRTLKKSLRRNIARREEQARERGLTIERFSGHQVTPEHVEAAAAIERRSWKRGAGVGIYGDDAQLGLHLDLVRARSLPFQLDYVFLRDGEKRVAFQYGFLFNRIYYAYNTSFVDTYRDSSPGLLLLNYLVKELIDSGMHTLDLLVGDDGYKLDWTSLSHELSTITIYAATPLGMACRSLDRLADRIKARRNTVNPVQCEVP